MFVLIYSFIFIYICCGVNIYLVMRVKICVDICVRVNI